jgi:hypothetical protein
MVDTITLGRPTGSARMPWVASEVPPEPPAPMTPPTSRRLAAVVAEDGGLALRVVARHFARVHAGRRGLAGGGQVHRDHPQAALLQALLEEEQFAALGVEGAGDVGGAVDGGAGWEFEDLGALVAWVRERSVRPQRWRRFCGSAGVAAQTQPTVILRIPAIHSTNGADRIDPITRLRMRAQHRQHAPFGHRQRRQFLFVLGRTHAQQAFLQGLVGRQLRRRQFVRDAAVDHHADAVGHGDGHAQVLLDQQHRDAHFLGQRAQGPRDLVHDHRRQALGRLVHHQHARLQQQGAGDGQHLLLAAGQLGAAVVLAFGQAREHGIGAGDLLAVLGHQAQGLVHRQRRPHAPPLRHVGDAAPRDGMRGQAQDLLAVQAHAAAGAHQAGDGVAQGALAHAVAAHQAQHAAFQREAHALQRMGAAVVDVQFAHFQHGGGAIGRRLHQCLPPM